MCAALLAVDVKMDVAKMQRPLLATVVSAILVTRQPGRLTDVLISMNADHSQTFAMEGDALTMSEAMSASVVLV